MEFKALRPKGEFKNLSAPDPGLLEVFPNPGVASVTLTVKEFTSLCPITGQPDYGTLTITYKPKALCLESKSLKLYLAGYRNYGTFAETLAAKVAQDLGKVLDCPVTVTTHFVSRGGISIDATSL